MAPRTCACHQKQLLVVPKRPAGSAVQVKHCRSLNCAGGSGADQLPRKRACRGSYPLQLPSCTQWTWGDSRCGWRPHSKVGGARPTSAAWTRAASCLPSPSRPRHGTRKRAGDESGNPKLLLRFKGEGIRDVLQSGDTPCPLPPARLHPWPGRTTPPEFCPIDAQLTLHYHFAPCSQAPVRRQRVQRRGCCVHRPSPHARRASPHRWRGGAAAPRASHQRAQRGPRGREGAQRGSTAGAASTRGRCGRGAAPERPRRRRRRADRVAPEPQPQAPGGGLGR